MKEKMKKFIKRHYPNAIFDIYYDTSYGQEYLFYPNEEAEECYTCINKNGHLIILTDF